MTLKAFREEVGAHHGEEVEVLHGTGNGAINGLPGARLGKSGGLAPFPLP